MQNITNICALPEYKSKIALFSFTQIHPSKTTGISPSVQKNYEQIATRLAPEESTYDGPASSLELVIDNMLTQKERTSQWEEFLHRWDDTLLSSARDAFEKRIKTYKQRGWTLEYFYTHLSKGCFPIHPIAAYLLCNLSFTQDRTAIQFIKKHVKKFIEETPVEDVGERLNYIHAIQLFDFFRKDFSNEGIYKRYEEAEKVVLGSNNPDELKALKALFLYSSSGQKLTKDDRDNHEELLGALAGISESRMKVALHSLMNTRELISYKPEIKLYRFWEGISPSGIKDEIQDLTRNQPTHLSSVVAHCTARMNFFLKSKCVAGTDFVKTHGLRYEDWQFELQFIGIDQVLRKLSSPGKLTNQRGLVLCVIAESIEEIQDLRRVINDALQASPYKEKVVVAIPSLGVGDLPRIKLQLEELGNIDPARKRMWGSAACDQLEQRWEEQINTTILKVIKSYTHHCIVSEQTLNKFRKNSTQQSDVALFVSAMLEEMFPLVPTVAGIDKLRSDHNTGKLIVGTVATQLLSNTLSPQTLPTQKFYKTVVDSVYVEEWGILRRTRKSYIPKEPTNIQVKAAWEEISAFTDLGEQSEQKFPLIKIWEKLSSPPYGYSEYNFSVILAAWLAYHRKEVLLEGPELVTSSNQLVKVKTLSLKEWANPDSDLFKDPKKFVNTWIVKCKAKLIRRKGIDVPELPTPPLDLNQVQEYLEKANNFLQSNEAEPGEVTGVQRIKEKVEAALEPITAWFQPVESTEALTDDAEIETLLNLYQQLKQPLPSYSLNSDVISVRLTTEQRSRHDAASQAIATRIEQYTEQVSLRSETLETTEACSTYQANLQNLINTFQQTSDLPEHLQEILQNALKVAERVRGSLEENARIQQLLEAAQAIAQPLNDYSSQADFTRVIGEIEAIRQHIPTEKAEADEVQLLLQDIDRQYRELNQKLDAWEERLTSATTQSQIVALLQETAKHRDRFTDPKSRERLDRLNDSLNRELKGIEDKSQTEKLLKAELDIARQPLQRLRDLPDARIVEAFQAYQELKGFEFTPVDDAELLRKYQEPLEGFKTQGNEQITKRFQQICDRKLSRLELYENRKESLQRAISALEETDEFAAIKTSLTQSLGELEAQAETLRQQADTQRKQAEDKQTIKEIQQLRPNQNSSIHACEESLAQIQMLQANLHFPEQFQAEISQILQACQDKINSHKQNLNALREQLATVNTSEVLNRLQLSHARLEAAFRDSSESEAYQAIGAAIDDIQGDLKTLDKLENRYQQADGIAACNEILEDLAQSEDLLRYPERFHENRLNRLEEQTKQKIDTYQRDLTQIEQQLTYASTPTEVRKLQQTLLKQSFCYANSDESERVEALTAEIETLVRLMPLLDMAKAANLDACNRQIDQLISWQNSSEGISQGIQDRISTALEELSKRRQKLLIEKQEHARSWLQSLNDKTSQMLNAMRESKKYDLASEVLKLIHDSRDEYVEFLNTAEQKVLFEIERQCLDEQNKHSGNQIITMFRQLPRSQRQALYKHLERYLVDQTEADLSGKSEEGWWQKLFRSDNQKTNQND
ncbi:hypothetical protein PN498_17785 [Oscillatoria sp. CS-180]|uniref:hypothetical protein n=1 Tax=Oscillatoria sp. CS-180 TaxID=3021720 RepID=UPI00232FCDD3|nr:hypothetical protein [Oscillatoria sp. CS-180]MDB9527851.1 hypothetical protein [Oscillatoria sp. CS-180]